MNVNIEYMDNIYQSISNQGAFGKLATRLYTSTI